MSGGEPMRRTRASVKAVSNVSFEVGRGTTFGLVGESGCGKTTLARIIVALETPTAGEVRLDGVALSSLSARQLRRARRSIQPVFQDTLASLDPRVPVGSIIREPLIVQRVGTKAEQVQRVSQLLDEVGLSSDLAERRAHELSGGQRQRVALARALALSPGLIAADEPVSALDASVRAQILNLMNDLQRSHQLTYLFISHDLSIIRYIADRTGVMYLGKLVEVGPARLVSQLPAHPYTASLIKAIPALDPGCRRIEEERSTEAEMPSPLHPPSGCRYRTRCPSATEICVEIEPPLRSFGAGRFAACHHPLQTPSVVDG